MVPGRRFRTALATLLAAGAITSTGGAIAQEAGDESGTASDRGSAARSSREEEGVYGWGPHIGLGGDPDQLLLGLHFDVGRIAPRVRFQPDVELGIGDNHTISHKARITCPG